jgi:hypothetical protein
MKSNLIAVLLCLAAAVAAVAQKADKRLAESATVLENDNDQKRNIQYRVEQGEMCLGVSKC